MKRIASFVALAAVALAVAIAAVAEVDGVERAARHVVGAIGTIPVRHVHVLGRERAGAMVHHSNAARRLPRDEVAGLISHGRDQYEPAVPDEVEFRKERGFRRLARAGSLRAPSGRGCRKKEHADPGKRWTGHAAPPGAVSDSARLRQTGKAMNGVKGEIREIAA